MSDRELAKELIDQIPENKIVLILPYLKKVVTSEVEEIEPDEWDLEMIEAAGRENDGTFVDIRDIEKELGATS